MSGLASAPAPQPVAPSAGVRLLDDADLRETLLRVLAFLAVASFAAFHWSSLVEDPPGGRIYGVVLVATGGGVLLAVVGRVANARVRIALASVISLATVWISLLAVGLPREMLPPLGWYELRDLLDRGLDGLQASTWPYSGDDGDVELTILLALPATIAPAALLAFWPSHRLQPMLRMTALVLLLILYGVGATEGEPDAPLLHGAVLLLLIAAWLWLPRLSFRAAGPASAAVVLAGIAAIPLAGGLDGERPWIDYESWRIADVDTAATETFDWNHSYGPIDWPREGRLVLEVRSRRAHYWKAETLNQFDGRRWLHATRARPGPSMFPDRLNRAWDQDIEFTIRSLRTSVLVSAGMTYDAEVPDHHATIRDGAVRVVDGPMNQGEKYTISTYAPDPDANQMRSAPAPRQTTYYAQTAIRLPLPGKPEADATPGPGEGVYALGVRDISVPLWRLEEGGTPGAESMILDSPYRRMYRLARRLAAGAPTVYDAVKRIEGHLQDNYAYSETPPDRNLPLDAFLFEDRLGYCQQFSGAMALLLRMNGIPARVAAGFTPGLRDSRSGRYEVRDLDAHSWVEVYFEGIGWVPFDPTPAAAPAESQSAGRDATSAARGDARDTGGGEDAATAQQGGGDDGGGSGGGGPVRVVLGLLAVIALLVAGTLWLASRRHRGPGAELDELRYALERLGYGVPPRATLLRLERTLGRAAGPAAARYVRALRERRFAAPATGRRSELDRRALRRALTRPLGIIARLQGWLVLPPRLPFSRFRAT